MSRLEEIKARCEAATPGPWMARDDYDTTIFTTAKGLDSGRTYGYGCDSDFICEFNDGERHEYAFHDEEIANAIFIANAREDIPFLLGEVDRLTREYKELDDAHHYLFIESCKLRAERDAALKDMDRAFRCNVCKYTEKSEYEPPCSDCYPGTKHFKWRGPQGGECENGMILIDEEKIKDCSTCRLAENCPSKYKKKFGIRNVTNCENWEGNACV